MLGYAFNPLAPEPWIVIFPGDESPARRVRADVRTLHFQAFILAEHMVEGLFLPDMPLASKTPIDRMRGGTLDPTHDLRQPVGTSSLVGERRKDQVDMVGHDDCNVHPKFRPVIVQTVAENQGSNCFG